MKQVRNWCALGVTAAALSLTAGTGCGSGEGISDILDELDIDINGAVDVIQTEDPRFVTLPSGFADTGNTIIIDNSVTIVDDVKTDVIVDELPDSLLLGFENVTGFDIYIQYFAENDLQGILVYDGETLILDYPCLSSVELVSEDDFDPFTGELVDSFDLSGGLFEEGFDYLCGDTIIFTFDFDAITTNIDVIDVLN